MKGEMNVLVNWAMAEGSHQGFLDKANLDVAPQIPVRLRWGDPVLLVFGWIIPLFQLTMEL